jgi:metallo-beta-lactamase class B
VLPIAFPFGIAQIDREDAMKRLFGLRLSAWFVGGCVLCSGIEPSLAQNPPPPDHPTVTVRGQTYTPRSILARNMGSDEERVTQFPPHRIIGNIYYVGTKMLSSYLITTPQGHILIDSTYERTVPVIEKSVTELGFKFSDIRVLLGNHAHGDHMEGDALVKRKTGAVVMVMEEDVPALREIKPGGKEHPIDKILHHGEQVTLGGTTLIAHLTPGHTRGCTTWTTEVIEGGKLYNVMFGCSLRPPAVLTPAIVEEFNRSLKTVRALPCDVQLGDHGAQYNMLEKHAKLKEGAPNPFVDPASCTLEADVQEAMVKAIQAEQAQANRP